VKPVAFDYERAIDVASAVKRLAAADGGAKVLAGGQSLGPMLNLRLAQPQLLVDIRSMEALRQASETADSVTIGACVTHAAIEDGAVPDPSRGFMRFVARDIAYRAVRNRGTIGGSLCHADPAADWLTALLALDATVLVQGVAGTREIAVQDFVEGAFSTALAEDEIVTAIRIPRLSKAARWSYFKFSRKPGEFAEAIAAFVVDPARSVCRAVIGATNGVPHVVAAAAALVRRYDEQAALQWVSDAGVGDEPYARQMHVVALKRAAAALQS
jgi:carbon-monoxide dehydrogenase medium subunit